ncbi:hypothetical protein [Amycolatopsis sp. CA-230715]|uniref:hypothetical protein n=1 Tax=Amycolatopsis sp. CA-230715 TaxID=2745196 RepID=UPI001C01146F|nr:hypothetical protein [Amycolatopsis sp. CA-230715]QWF82866.1 hypothetical protein HUW46_06305 [Amycolatopsis sp. CA-230715]
MSRKVGAVVLAVAGLVVTSVAPAAAETSSGTRCSVAKLPYPAGTTSASVAAVGDDGSAVGIAAGKAGVHGYWWRADGSITDLGDFDPTAIGPGGTIVGSTPGKDGQGRAAVWRDGAVTVLPGAADRGSDAVDVNRAGDITGVLSTSDTTQRAVVWPHDRPRSVVYLDSAEGFTTAVHLDDSGYVIGQAGDVPPNMSEVVWGTDGRQVRRYGPGQQGEPAVVLHDIARGRIVGIDRTGGDPRMVVIDASTGRSAPVPLAEHGSPNAISDRGAIVGSESTGEHGVDIVPTIWSGGAKAALPGPDGALFFTPVGISGSGRFAAGNGHDAAANFALRWTCR